MKESEPLEHMIQESLNLSQKKIWEKQINEIVKKFNQSEITDAEIVQDLLNLKPGFCNEVKIQRLQTINSECFIFFDNPDTTTSLNLATLTPLSVSVVNLFAKESIPSSSWKKYPLWKQHENILVELDKNALFNPPKEKKLKVFFQFLYQNGLDQYPNLKLDKKTYKDFAVLTTVPTLKDSEKWFFPKSFGIQEFSNVLLATGDFPKTRSDAYRFYQKLNFVRPEMVCNERT